MTVTFATPAFKSVFKMIFVLRCVSEIRWEWPGPSHPYTGAHQFHRAGSCSGNALYLYSEMALFESQPLPRLS